MTDHHDPTQPHDVLDELATQLLACGGVLSQIISHMVGTAASGGSAPDAAPIPDVAHTLIRDVIAGLAQRHSRKEIRTAAVILDEGTNAIAENVFLVPADPGGN